MKLSSAGLDLIKEFEGYHERQPDGSAKAYRCPANVLTIGWGCTEGVKEGMTVTAEQATAMLATEMAKHEAAVERLVKVPLTQGQFDAVFLAVGAHLAKRALPNQLEGLKVLHAQALALQQGAWRRACVA